MTETSMPLIELLQKQDDGDFLRAVAEAVLQLLMSMTSRASSAPAGANVARAGSPGGTVTGTASSGPGSGR
jgi:hypothetical protein